MQVSASAIVHASVAFLKAWSMPYSEFTHEQTLQKRTWARSPLHGVHLPAVARHREVIPRKRQRGSDHVQRDTHKQNRTLPIPSDRLHEIEARPAAPASHMGNHNVTASTQPSRRKTPNLHLLPNAIPIHPEILGWWSRRRSAGVCPSCTEHTRPPSPLPKRRGRSKGIVREVILRTSCSFSRGGGLERSAGCRCGGLPFGIMHGRGSPPTRRESSLSLSAFVARRFSALLATVQPSRQPTRACRSTFRDRVSTRTSCAVL